MSKLGTKPSTITDLNDNQKRYISVFGQEKFDSLAGRRKNDDAFLLKHATEGNADVTEKSTKTNDVTISNEQYTSIMEQIAGLQRQVEENTKKPFDEGKKRYEGPRNYSYKIWTGMPVLGYQSKLRDETYGLTYTNQVTGKLVNNQMLELACFDLSTGEKVKKVVDSTVFGNAFERSDKIPARIQRDSTDKIVGYTFNVGGKEFTVLTSCIN